MKRIWIGLGLIGLVSIIGLSCYIWYQSQLSPVNPVSTQTVSVTIAPGQSVSATLADLVEKQLIKSEFAAKIYTRLNKLDQTILPGTYTVSPRSSVSEIFKTISTGPEDVRITIPEGWRREQIASHLDNLISSPNFSASQFLSQTTSMEGQIFPDTYLFSQTASTTEVIKIITANFQAKVGQVDTATLILASLIEREARTSSERPIIAGILKNRLDSQWPLQVDATVQYGQDSITCASKLAQCDWWTPPSDTQFSTIYNTYLHPGLPPGPICNPGLASIEAARNPAITPYMFYLTGNDGVTYYARTLDEHNLNVDKHLLP